MRFLNPNNDSPDRPAINERIEASPVFGSVALESLFTTFVSLEVVGLTSLEGFSEVVGASGLTSSEGFSGVTGASG